MDKELSSAATALSLLARHIDQAFLIETPERRIQLVNQRFCDLFRIPADPETLRGADCSGAAEQVQHLFLNPAQFLQRIQALLEGGEKSLGESLFMRDGRILMRDFIPVREGDEFLGYLWTYTDVTRHALSEELQLAHTINYFLSSLYNQETVEDLLWDVANNCISQLGFTDCVIYLRDPETGCLEQKAAWGPKSDQFNRIVNPIVLKPGMGIVGSVARSGLAEIVADTSQDPRYIEDDEFRLSEITVPIMANGEVLGVIDSEHPERGFFTARHLRILTAVASLCAIKLTHLQAAGRQRAETEQQKVFYQEILNNLPADIAVFDASHRYLFVNPQGIRNPEIRAWLIGRRDEDYCELRNKPYSIFEERRRYFLEAINTGNQVEWEESLAGPDGEETFHLRKFFPVSLPGQPPHLVIGYGVNITERKRVENAVRIQEKKYRDLFNFSPAVIITQDLSLRVTAVNPAVQRVLGYPDDYLLGRPLYELLPPAEREETWQRYEQAFRSAGEQQFLLPLLPASGKQVYLLCHSFCVEEAGQDPYVILFGQDITDRIRMEEHLQQARLQSEQNLQAKESFLARVSHEIRTPMNGILGVADLLRRTTTRAQQDHYIEVLKQSAEQLLALVNSVLDIEKAISGKMLLECKPFDLRQVTELLSDVFAGPAQERDNQLQIHYEVPGSPFFTGDPFRLSQVLNNLLSNAVKFTRNGSITLTVSLVAESPEGCDIRFRVTDTGRGIPAHLLEEIFEPFSQGYRPGERQEPGTGLGLTICRELVALMGGRLRVESAEGRGSVFEAALVLVRADAPPVKAVPESNDWGWLTGKKILVAEDMELNRFLVAEMMREAPVTLHFAEDGQEVLDRTERNTYDLILMDIQMPRLSGTDATRRLRAQASNPNHRVPVIAMTANVFEKDRAQYLAAGMNDVLPKPFDAEQLHRVLRSYLLIRESHAEAVRLPAAEKADPPLSFDLTYLRRVGQNRKGFMEMMLRSFRESTIRQLAELEELRQAAAWDKLPPVLHTLKFSLGVMGLESLQQELAWLEEQARSGVTGEDPAFGSRLQVFLSQLGHLCTLAGSMLEAGVEPEDG